MAYESKNQYKTRKYISLLEGNNCWPKSNNYSAHIVVDITSKDNPEIIARGRNYIDAAHEWFKNMKEKTFFQREIESQKELYQHIDKDTVKNLKDKLRDSCFLPLFDKQFSEFKDVNKEYNVEIEYK